MSFLKKEKRLEFKKLNHVKAIEDPNDLECSTSEYTHRIGKNTYTLKESKAYGDVYESTISTKLSSYDIKMLTYKWIESVKEDENDPKTELTTAMVHTLNFLRKEKEKTKEKRTNFLICLVDCINNLVDYILPSWLKF